MSGALKQEFIEAVRLTPDGIQGFLETLIPAPPACSIPSDVDAAIIANGTAAYYILELFRPFAGLTPIELLLRIGQHNNVLESAMLAGLEYIEGADEGESDLTINEPAAGVSYSPGEMRFIASTKNGNCETMMLTVDGGDPVRMYITGDTGQQFVTLTTPGEHSASVTATFSEGGDKTATVNFSIAEAGTEPPPDPPPDPAEPPGGKDKEALKRLKTAIEAAYRQLVSFGNLGDPGEYKSRMAAFLSAVSQFLAAITITSTTITTCRSAIVTQTGLINTILGKSEISTADLENATNSATKVLNNVNMIYSLAVQ